MNREKMSKFIADYLQNDKTTFAMMLSGEWGTGKSFYIKSELKEYKKIKDNGNELMVISLYGMSNLQELSQRICYERFHTSINAVKAIEATAKTIINYSPLPQIFWTGVGKVADKIKEKIDESVDLTGILLVLEDVERTKIDLEDFFGYVNNLCEQDNVKVLLIADEEKIREKLDNYDKIKDKVVGDTIHFEPDLEATLRNIFDIYGFNDVCDLDADMSDIREIITQRPNFRKVIYACQKVHEIFKHEEFKEYNYDKYKDFRKCVFLSALSFIHNGKDAKYEWDGYFLYNKETKEIMKQHRVSPILGEKINPLPCFVYEYLKFQNIVLYDFKYEYQEYKKYRMFDTNIDRDHISHFIESCNQEELSKMLVEVGNCIDNQSILFNFHNIINDFAIIKATGINIDEFMKKLIDRLSCEIRQYHTPISQTAKIKIINAFKDTSLCNYKEQIQQILSETSKYEVVNGDLDHFFHIYEIKASDMDIFIDNVSPHKLAEFISNSEYNVGTALSIREVISDYPITKNSEWFNELKNELKSIAENFKGDKIVKWYIEQCIEIIEKALANPEKYKEKPQMPDIND